MRILLTGGSGQVGTALSRCLPALGELLAPARSELDLDDPDACAETVRRLRPDLLINAAAYTAVDAAEQDPARAWRINAEAPAAMARALAASGGWLLHYSTDYVFDGQARLPYREDQPTAPLSVYGRSKRAGEEAIAASGCPHRILRTAWVYAAQGRNFLLTVLRLARERESLRIVDDQIGSPTSAEALAVATQALIPSLLRHPEADGLLHLSCAGQTSWAGFARAIVEGGARRGLCPLRPVVGIPSQEYPTAAQRPAWSVLSGERLWQQHRLRLPDWPVALERCLDQLAAQPPP
ncbi:MAG TPA: dTDP-4-dehydrorhamnose reductase [Nevskiaceae bacterium]|nr:dTDP-4-dehydrorhamnose reductase [Nevskiaceae bacterium]